jgi:hypothetical protein
MTATSKLTYAGEIIHTAVDGDILQHFCPLRAISLYICIYFKGLIRASLKAVVLFYSQVYSNKQYPLI